MSEMCRGFLNGPFSSAGKNVRRTSACCLLVIFTSKLTERVIYEMQAACQSTLGEEITKRAVPFRRWTEDRLCME